MRGRILTGARTARTAQTFLPALPGLLSGLVLAKAVRSGVRAAGSGLVQRPLCRPLAKI